MANANGGRYCDRRSVEELLVSNSILVGHPSTATNGGIGRSTGNSLSLEELFINGVRTPPRRTIGTNGEQSSQDIIRLDHPRPEVVRARNEYVDVTGNKATQSTNRPVVFGRQSMGHFPLRSNNNNNNTAQMVDEPAAAAAQRAHSMPLSCTTAIVCPSIGGQTNNCLYCAGRSQVIRLNNANQMMSVNRLPDSKPANFPALTGCQPSTSLVTDKLPVPGRAIRLTNMTNRNGSVLLPTANVISSQPKKSSTKNDKNGKRDGDCWWNEPHRSTPDCSSSIICKNCGLCRCDSCARPRTLPSRSICNKSCLLSKDKMVDTISCMYCVKGCLYHVGANSNDYDAQHHRECSCSRNCILRWTILTWAAVCLPCVWCYFPLKACAAGVEALYSRYHDHGCKCDQLNERRRSSPTNHGGGHCPRRRSKGADADRSVTRRLRRKRSHTLPPELPSIAAARATATAACGNCNRTVGCDASTNYS